MITPKILLPLCQQLWANAVSALPAEHSRRWVASRTIGRHGTRSTILYWAVWDARCTSHGIDHRYLGWNLNYDPERYYNPNSDWRLQLYVNTVRLYRHGEKLRTILPRRVKAACAGGFKFLKDDHSVHLVWDFDHSGPLEELPGRVTPVLAKALVLTAPIFDQVFSIIAQPASTKESDKLRGPLKRTSDPKALSSGGALSRGIGLRLRTKVLEAYGRKCHICGKLIDLREELHIDHVISWSAGGLTELENLRPSHAICNLRKGGRQS